MVLVQESPSSIGKAMPRASLLRTVPRYIHVIPNTIGVEQAGLSGWDAVAVLNKCYTQRPVSYVCGISHATRCLTDFIPV